MHPYTQQILNHIRNIEDLEGLNILWAEAAKQFDDNRVPREEQIILLAARQEKLNGFYAQQRDRDRRTRR